MAFQRRVYIHSVAPPGLQGFFGILFPGLAPWAIDVPPLRACKTEGERHAGNLLGGLHNLVLFGAAGGGRSEAG